MWPPAGWRRTVVTANSGPNTRKCAWWGRWSLWEMIPHGGDEVLEHGRFVWWCPQWRDVPQGSCGGGGSGET